MLDKRFRIIMIKSGQECSPTRKRTWQIAGAIILSGGLGSSAGCAVSPFRAFHPEIQSARVRASPIWIYQVTLPGVLRNPEHQLVVPVDVTFINTSREPINKIQFVYLTYDSLGILRRDRQNNLPLALVLRVPGPFEPGHAYEVDTQPEGLPGLGTSCIRLVSLSIHWPDRAVRIHGKALTQDLAPILRKHCADLGPAIFVRSQGGR